MEVRGVAGKGGKKSQGGESQSEAVLKFTLHFSQILGWYFLILHTWKSYKKPKGKGISKLKELKRFQLLSLQGSRAWSLMPKLEGPDKHFGFSLKKKIIYLFIYFWLCWVFVAALGFSLAAAGGGFSLRWLLLLQSRVLGHTGFSSWDSWALEPRLSSYGARTWLLCGMWDPPGPGIKPVSPTIANRFFTNEPVGKPPL